MILNNIDEFYPTPQKLIDKMLAGLKCDNIFTALEPSAGKGDIADEIARKLKSEHWRSANDNAQDYVDCIEISSDLRHILKGKGYRVVQDDFLTFKPSKKYDLIVMNPPFSNGDMHLLKALELMENGGTVICLLNAETLKNSYTNTRKLLSEKLKQYNAEIEYISNGFNSAERKTDVEIAIIKTVIKCIERESFIFEDLRKKAYEERAFESNAVVSNDYISESVKQYEIEVEAGIRLINEYKAMSPYIRKGFSKDGKYTDKNPTIEMHVDGMSEYSADKLSINKYVEVVRVKYWSELFENEKFIKSFTSNLKNDLQRRVQELKDFDFSVYNIKQIFLEMVKRMGKGVEETILNLFDKLTAQHSWYPETSGNIHYFNGWSTNKAHRINKKVIMPMNGSFSGYGWSKETFNTSYVYSLMQDIEKTLSYLETGDTFLQDDLWERLKTCSKNGTTKKIPLRYFNITLYKKGTCHIEFTNIEMLDKLNIFGCQRKAWLPPCYGKKKYSDLNVKEKSVIDEFQGEQAYKQVMTDPKRYIIEPKNILMLGSVR